MNSNSLVRDCKCLRSDCHVLNQNCELISANKIRELIRQERIEAQKVIEIKPIETWKEIHTIT